MDGIGDGVKAALKKFWAGTSRAFADASGQDLGSRSAEPKPTPSR